MAKTKISEFSATPSNNTDIDGINIAEGCAPSSINNAIRELMSQLKDQQAGTSGDSFTVGGNLSVAGSVTLVSALPIAQGGTGNTTASSAINALMPTQTSNSGKYLTTNGSAISWGAVAPGTGTVTSVGLTSALSGITVTGSPITTTGSITLSGTLAVANGGTGVASMTSGAVLVGNGTNPVAVISPGTDKNVLMSNGTSWASTPVPEASATVSGVVGTGTQTFAGNKTFASSATFSSGASFAGATSFTGAVTYGSTATYNGNATFNSGFFATSHNFTSNTSWFWNGSDIGGYIAGVQKFFMTATSAGFTIADVQKVGGGTFNSYSDSRYKQDIASYTLGLSAINEITPKSYKFTAAFMNDSKPSDTFIGVIAQELEGTSFAGCVTEDANGFKIVDTSQLTFALINAVKELDAKIKALESK